MKTKKESMWVGWNGFRRLMGVKKGTFDKRVKDSKEDRKNKADREYRT